MWLKILNRIAHEHKLTATHFVEAAGASNNYWSKVLNGATSQPSSGKMLKVLNYLEKNKYISEKKSLVLLQEIIKGKLKTSELILLNQYEEKLRDITLESEDFLKMFHRFYINNLVVNPEVIDIIQSLQLIPDNQMKFIKEFIDFIINSDDKRIKKLLDFLSPD